MGVWCMLGVCGGVWGEGGVWNGHGLGREGCGDVTEICIYGDMKTQPSGFRSATCTLPKVALVGLSLILLHLIRARSRVAHVAFTYVSPIR